MTPQPRPGPGNRAGSDGSWARFVNALAAVWLFISAFAWPHSAALHENSWVTAVLMFIAAIWAVEKPMIRYANTVLAIWLFLSTAAMRGANETTTWNNLIVAIVVFIFSLVSSRSRTTRPDRPAASHP
jgi:hypothetical protein